MSPIVVTGVRRPSHRARRVVGGGSVVGGRRRRPRHALRPGNSASALPASELRAARLAVAAPSRAAVAAVDLDVDELQLRAADRLGGGIDCEQRVAEHRDEHVDRERADCREYCRRVQPHAPSLAYRSSFSRAIEVTLASWARLIACMTPPYAVRVSPAMMTFGVCICAATSLDLGDRELVIGVLDAVDEERAVLLHRNLELHVGAELAVLRDLRLLDLDAARDDQLRRHHEDDEQHEQMSTNGVTLISVIAPPDSSS